MEVNQASRGLSLIAALLATSLQRLHVFVWNTKNISSSETYKNVWRRYIENGHDIAVIDKDFVISLCLSPDLCIHNVIHVD